MGGMVPNVEDLRWMPTSFLRHFKPTDGESRLEVLWESAAGATEWRPVKTVTEGEKTDE